jgi:ubiquinone/menaquinone biosynthesis C-methylase UbiE
MKTEAKSRTYLMENAEEIQRLEMKTKASSLLRQACWAGLKPGMRVADIGCGPGKTTSLFKEVVGNSGEVVGVDFSRERIEYAQKTYGGNGVSFICRDIFAKLEDFGKFDFVWSRFFLEYHKARCAEVIRIFDKLLKPGGTMCLVDLDSNCLNHYGLSEKLDQTIKNIMKHLEVHHDFDPFVGKKIYSHIYDLGYVDIDVMVEPHHLIFGVLDEVDAFNWYKKALVAGKQCGYGFEEYAGGFEEFLREYETFFRNPRRFTYTPLIACRGVKPSV